MESGILSRKYIIPPFTTLDAKSAVWQQRKRAWLALGLRSEIGRNTAIYSNKWATEKGIRGLCANHTDISVFDPVLTECLVEWFCPQGGRVLDPFAGGAVRGVVSSRLGRAYIGVDLRAEQVAANIEQKHLGGAGEIMWVCGDSSEILRTQHTSDMILTCPPYGDLEVYSDDPADLSSVAKLSYIDFLMSFGKILTLATESLKQDSFASVVVSNYRDRKGVYRNLVGDTVDLGAAAGLTFYNELILLTPLGSAAMRADKQFTTSRKHVKVHQTVLIFVKGDPRAATARCALNAPAEMGCKDLPAVSKPKRRNTGGDVSVAVASQLPSEAGVDDGSVGVEDGGAVDA